MEKRLIVAIALSIFIIIGFQQVFAPAQKKLQVQNIPIEKIVEPALEKEAFKELPGVNVAAEETTVVETDKYIVTFSNVGGAIKEIRLKAFKQDGGKEALALVSLNDPREYLLSAQDTLNQYPLQSSLFNLTRKGNDVIYSLRIKDIEVVKRYILPNSYYHMQLEMTVKNLSDTQHTLGYQLIGGAGLAEKSPADKRFEEVTANIDERSVGFKAPKKGRITHPGSVSWVALKNKFFSVIMKPFCKTKSQFYHYDDKGALVSGIETDDVTMPPKSFVEYKFLLYAGPGDIAHIKASGYQLDESVNYGIFGWIAKGMLAVMKFFYSFVHSWGVAIILLAIFFNVILFTLTVKSMKSMKKMQALHPQMEKLKAELKDNPQKLNKEIMELYKKYKINPLGGCLPLILQMPVFIALYQALQRSIDLRGASFLWIKDLSLPDALLIPFTLPFIGNHINILLIAMIVAMVAQQKMSTKTMGAAVTAEQKQQQQIMLIVMPVMFTFIFMGMPAGLVLYWLLNTVLTVVEQYVILKQA
jgi:YidC/Oxa1 family membrane protein insertase